MDRLVAFVSACTLGLAACAIGGDGGEHAAPTALDGKPPPASSERDLGPAAGAHEGSPVGGRAPNAGDSERIVFSARLAGSSSLDLYSVLPNGSSLRKLTHTGSRDETFPRWSPDRAKVA